VAVPTTRERGSAQGRRRQRLHPALPGQVGQNWRRVSDATSASKEFPRGARTNLGMLQALLSQQSGLPQPTISQITAFEEMTDWAAPGSETMQPAKARHGVAHELGIEHTQQSLLQSLRNHS
jgi:hypothetical protein